MSMHRLICGHECLHAFEGQEGIVGGCLCRRSECENLSLEHSGFLVFLSHRGVKRLSRSRCTAAVKIGRRGKVWFIWWRTGLLQFAYTVLLHHEEDHNDVPKSGLICQLPQWLREMECRKDQFLKGTAVTKDMMMIKVQIQSQWFFFCHDEWCSASSVFKVNKEVSKRKVAALIFLGWKHF